MRSSPPAVSALVAVTKGQRKVRNEYDALHRPTRQWFHIWSRASGTADAFKPKSREIVERMEYRDAQADDFANLNGHLVRHYDPSGLVETIRRDMRATFRKCTAR